MTSFAKEIPRAYNPSEVEGPIYKFWMENGYFAPNKDSDKKPFVIIMPPPNVTGELHLGHALTASIEDMLARWHRMLGDPTLWLPGKDHAGIATQVVVERQLAKQGLSRHDLGRDKFIAKVWEWVDQYGNRIDEQHKRLGSSCDWSRLSFTLDPGPSLAVRTTFVNLHKKDLIYRGERIINWCVRCSSALSDLEVDHQQTEGYIYYVHYPLTNEERSIVIATTRPETMLGDVAVAVHPSDERYQHLIGREVTLPIIGRRLAIVADEIVDPEFGTGAIKVTPGHDPVDFEIGQRHSLEVITVIGEDGKMTTAAGPFEGQDRLQARDSIVATLEASGNLEERKPYSHSVGHCQRCHTLVEPLVSKQWFIRIKPLAEPAIEAIQNGSTKIVPEKFVKVYTNWLESIRDWCISRQLWWGHRIPVWYCDSCEHLTIQIEDPTECDHCGSDGITQDPDVLDTWFSSGLWTHSTLGWPNDTEDLSSFYPTSVMETGYDILFFWVARMMMLGIENMGEPPFETILLHGLVRDAEGVKMSKTKGNVLDPLALIDMYGTDALRFALTTGTAPGNDLRLSESKLESSRNFANKLWNASRFVLGGLGNASTLYDWRELNNLSHREDRWIISRLNRVVNEVNQCLERFETGEAQHEIYDFLWNEFCDWYIELAKVRLREQSEPCPLPILAHILEKTLRLLHPFMPFITEELWQKLITYLPEGGQLADSVMISPYPQVDESKFDPQCELEMRQLISMVRAVRNVRSQLQINPNDQIKAIVDPKGFHDLVTEERQAIEALAKLEALEVATTVSDLSKPDTVTVVADQVVIALPLNDVVDLVSERNRLTTELQESLDSLSRIETLLSRQEFLSKAPEEVVSKERERAKGLLERSDQLRDILKQLSG